MSTPKSDTPRTEHALKVIAPDWTPQQKVEYLATCLRTLERELSRGRWVPEGWKLVPVEPTLEMIDAAFDLPHILPHPQSVWDAMLSALPPEPQS